MERSLHKVLRQLGGKADSRALTLDSGAAYPSLLPHLGGGDRGGLQQVEKGRMG